MFVEKWMTPEVITLPPDATISFAAVEMNRRKFRHFPVVESAWNGKRLVGILSKYDIARGFPGDLNPFSIEVNENTVARPVSSIMTKQVITTTMDCPIEEAARILRTHRIGALPVVKDSRVVGIITESDVFDAMISVTAAKSGGTRLMIESDATDNPAPGIIRLCAERQVTILSMLCFRENRLKRKDLSIFRFDGRIPAGFLQAVAKLGYRVVSVER